MLTREPKLQIREMRTLTEEGPTQVYSEIKVRKTCSTGNTSQTRELQNTSGVDPTRFYSEIGVRETCSQRNTGRSPRNAKSKRSGPHSNMFGVRSSGTCSKRNISHKSAKCELREKWRRSDGTQSIGRPTSKGWPYLKGKRSNGCDRFGDRQYRKNSSDPFGKGRSEGLGERGFLSI